MTDGMMKRMMEMIYATYNEQVGDLWKNSNGSQRQSLR